MKIGIATVHDSSNLGSFLQALGMQEMVKSMGDTPYIIETRKHYRTYCLFIKNNATFAATCSYRQFLSLAFDSIRHIRRYRPFYKKYFAYKRDWSRFEHIISFSKTQKMDMDAILLGSDEIWNVNKPAFQNPLLYGAEGTFKKKIAYAVSCGDASAENFNSYPQLVESIENLDGIFVRDEHTRQVIHGLNVAVNGRICDPTLQVDIRKYMKSADKVRLPVRPYIVVYAYNVNPSMQKIIKRFAAERGLSTVAVSLAQPWCDEYLNCSPLEFGAVLESAKYVFTATFHGTIFSSLYHKKFITYSSLPKVVDVLNLLGMENAQLAEGADYELFCEKIEQEYDFGEMEQRILKIREESRQIYQTYVKGV